MNVQRLEQLAETVEKGYHIFDGNLNVMFNMATFFKQGSQPSDKHYADSCLIGFTILLFGGDKSLLHKAIDRSLDEKEQEINSLNLDAEARNLLDISEADSHELFYGSLSNQTQGFQAAAVIRKYLKTGKVVWPM